MRVASIIAVLLLIAVNAVALLNALALLPPAQLAQVGPFQTQLLGAALALGGVVLLTILLWRRPREPAPRVVTAEAARPQPAPAPPPQPERPEDEIEAGIVGFLAALQEKGRLVDFLMDDINAYDDGQVGAAARVVHAGCKSVLQENFRILPVRQESEGATVQVTPGYAADEYRLLGRVAGQPPFTGVLVHRGWKTEAVKLPRVLRRPGDRLPTIAPAEVELK